MSMNRVRFLMVGSVVFVILLHLFANISARKHIIFWLLDMSEINLLYCRPRFFLCFYLKNASSVKFLSIWLSWLSYVLPYSILFSCLLVQFLAVVICYIYMYCTIVTSLLKFTILCRFYFVIHVHFISRYAYEHLVSVVPKDSSCTCLPYCADYTLSYMYIQDMPINESNQSINVSKLFLDFYLIL